MEKSDRKLNLEGVVCPINFVKVKLELEQMNSGGLLEVILDDGEPIKNVPRSVKDEGHKILSVEKLEGKYRLLIQKA